MRHDVVWRVERLAVIGIGDDGHRAVMLPAHDAPVEILAGKLPPLEIEGVAIGVVGRPTVWRDPAVLPDVAVLRVAGDVAEIEIAALARSRRALRLWRLGAQKLQRAIAGHQRAERRIDNDHVRVWVELGRLRGP